MNRYIVTLTKKDREALCGLTSKGKHNSQKTLYALILVNYDKGE